MSLSDQLASLVGAAHVSPDLVVAPADAAQTAEVMKLAASAGAVIAPLGGGTRQRLGSPLVALDRPVVRLSTARLDQVLDYTPEDMTISVGAGLTKARLSEVLAPNGQMLPVDVALPARSTIGGLLAAGADGPRRLGYGTARDLFLGLRVAEAGGRLTKAGGMTVKNVSGYDLMRLHFGALGSLGVIVSANFKLLPIPRAVATITCQFDSLTRVFALVDALHVSKLTPTACELIKAERGYTLCVQADGLPQAVARHLRDVPALAAQHGASSSEPQEGAAHQVLWEHIHDLPQTADLAADELVLRLATLPSKLLAALTAAEQGAQKHQLEFKLSARALSGVAYLRLRGRGLKPFHAELTAATPEASIVVLGQGTPDPTLDVWGRRPGGLEVMRRIKREFDPTNLLNPGRYLV